LAAFCTSKSRSICEHRPSATGSIGCKVGRIPVRAVADLLDRVLGRADQARDLRVLQFRMVAHQPQDRVRAVLALGDRRVARALLAQFRHHVFRLRDLQLVVRIAFGLGDFLARQLAGIDRVEALDALRRFAVRDRLHLKRVQLAELGDLVEGQRRVVDEPDGGRLGHQKRVCHWKYLSCSSAPVPRAWYRTTDFRRMRAL
jgi:hypothetical protein